MPEIRIAPLLLADAGEIDRPTLLVHPQHLGDIADPGRYLVLQASGLQVVQIELAPPIALREPENLVRFRKKVPVDATVARFEERRGRFVEYVADGAGLRLGDAELLVFVIARGRDECHLRRVRA